MGQAFSIRVDELLGSIATTSMRMVKKHRRIVLVVGPIHMFMVLTSCIHLVYINFDALRVVKICIID